MTTHMVEVWRGSVYQEVFRGVEIESYIWDLERLKGDVDETQGL